MATIDLELHLGIDEIVERLKAEGWVIPVRCKDCKHDDNPLECPLFDFGKMDNDYCSFGECKGENRQ